MEDGWSRCPPLGTRNIGTHPSQSWSIVGTSQQSYSSLSPLDSWSQGLHVCFTFVFLWLSFPLRSDSLRGRAWVKDLGINDLLRKCFWKVAVLPRLSVIGCGVELWKGQALPQIHTSKELSSAGGQASEGHRGHTPSSKACRGWRQCTELVRL